MRPSLLLAALLLAVSVVPGAIAQERPVAVPTRDVSVTYRASGQGNVPAALSEVRMSWLAARNLMRMDMPGGMGWLLVDLQAGTGIMVIEATRMIMNMPAGQLPPGGLGTSQTARYTREGPARIADLDCVNWRVEERGEAARVCLTSQGVLLRAESLNDRPELRGTLEATAVSFAAQDAARFQRPAGYQSLQLPAGIPGGMPPGGAQGMPRGTAIPPPGMTTPPR